MDAPSTSAANPYRLASAMLRHDVAFLLLIYPILIVPSFLKLLWLPGSGAALTAVLLIDRLSEMLVLTAIGIRWLAILQSDARRVAFIPLFVRLTACGFIVWAAIVAPLMLGVRAGNETSFLIGLVLLAPGTAFAVRHFFYFIPILLGAPSVREALAEARKITQEERSSPLKVLAAPFAIMTLLTSLALVPAPDGRSLAVSIASALFEGTFWILSSYLGLAFGFIAAPIARWRARNLDPYRDQRLATIESRAPSLLSRMLTAKSGLKIFVVAMFVVLGNYMREATMAPSPTITLMKLEAGDNSVRVSLRLDDPEYRFRGFNPYAFMLAGEAGNLVSKGAPKVHIDGVDDESNFRVPSSFESAVVDLNFETSRKGSDIRELEDLWLWYQYAKVVRVSKDVLNDGTPP